MSFDPVQLLADRFREALATAVPEVHDPDPVITPSRNPKFGDFQSNAAMGIGKRLGKQPRDVAQTIVEAVNVEDIAEPITPASIAGPGFINITLKPEAIAGLLGKLDTPTLGIDPPADPERVVVDVCGVNLAKQMHVGHLRSSVIGDCIARVFERQGYDVVRQNHVGDWGLPIAMVVTKLIEESAAGRIDLATLTLDELDRLYKLAQLECSADKKGLEAARKWWSHPKAIAELEAQVEGASAAMTRAKETLVRLQSQDPETVAVWQRIFDVTMRACLATCARLHTRITNDATAGESSYAGELKELVRELEASEITEHSDGALVIRNDGIEEPTIIRKADGGFLYATTDMAAIRRRVQTIGASRVVYCVDARQSLHFKQVFASAVRAGYATHDGVPARLEHAAFGMILGPDRKPFKTRSGQNVKLADLLDEAVERAATKLDEMKQEQPGSVLHGMPQDELARIAEVVGIAAIKYADLSNERIRDYVFEFDRMIQFEGNTGPYLLYALARIRSIFRNAQEQGVAIGDGPFAIGEPAEKTLALTLLRYPGVMDSVGESIEPHRLCTYLYDLASAYSAFYQQCPVLKAQDAPTRDARLRLCSLTERVLEDGLSVLGIQTLDRM